MQLEHRRERLARVRKQRLPVQNLVLDLPPERGKTLVLLLCSLSLRQDACHTVWR